MRQGKRALGRRVKEMVRGWLGIGPDDGQSGGGSVIVDAAAGVTVSARKALSLAAVWSCTRLISQTIATLPLGMFERQADGSRKPADDLQIAKLLAIEPNADMSAVVFWESIIGQALLMGNGFGEKKRIGQRVVAIDLLNSERLTWKRKAGGGYEYRYVEANGKARTLSDADVFHLPGFTMWGKFGMSVIRYGAEVFGSALAGNQAANSTFKNGLQPTTYFKYANFLKKDQRDAFDSKVDRLRGSLNAGKQPLLEGGIDVGEIGINPDDAQLLESRIYSKEEICSWFGVPPSMIGTTDKSSSWASSAEQLNLWFLKYTLRPWLKRIEQAIWSQLLTPAERNRYYAEYQVEGLLRADTAARTAFYASALQNGYINRDTVANLENLPKPVGGEIYTVQSNLVPVDQLGKTAPTSAAAASDAIKAWLGINDDERKDDATQG